MISEERREVSDGRRHAFIGSRLLHAKGNNNEKSLKLEAFGKRRSV